MCRTRNEEHIIKVNWHFHSDKAHIKCKLDFTWELIFKTQIRKLFCSEALRFFSLSKDNESCDKPINIRKNKVMLFLIRVSESLMTLTKFLNYGNTNFPFYASNFMFNTIL